MKTSQATIMGTGRNPSDSRRSENIKGVGNLFIDGIVVFSVEDSHAAPSTPRCWRPRLSCPELPSRATPLV